MLKVIFNNGAYFPVLECCQCHRPIVLDGKTSHVNRRTAKVLFDKEGNTAFAHQLCDDESYPMWEPIDTFIFRLLHNTGLHGERLKRAMEFDAWGVGSNSTGGQRA
jgi:hypothetical protein